MHLRLRRPAAALLATALATGVLAAAPAAHAADGTLSGVVTGPGGVPVANVDVDLYAYDASAAEWDYVDGVTSNGSGAYSLSTPPGDYRVGFFPSTDAHVYEYYDNAATVEAATTFSIPDGGSRVLNAELAAPGAITGTVTGPPGSAGALGALLMRPYAGPTQPEQYWPGWEIITFVRADAAGAYSFPGLRAGSYRVGFVPENPGIPSATAIEWYDDQVTPYSAKDVVVTSGQVTAGINAVVAAGSTITGTVTDAAGNPQTSTMVTALTKVGKDWQPAFMGMTNSLGSYAIHGLAASTYRVRFDTYSAPGSVATTEYWQDKGLISNATGIALAAGQTVTGIDARVVPGEHAAERKRVVQNTALPTITGTPVVGATLTASTGAWTPAPSSYAVQWMRGDQPIVGAIGATYVPTEADLGARLSVVVTASEDDSDSASARSAATAPVDPSPAAVRVALKKILKKLKTTGKPVVGTTVKVKGLAGSFRADARTKVRYKLQWFAGSKKIKKATKTKLKISRSLRGKKISVTVTATAAGTKVSRKLILGKAR